MEAVGYTMNSWEIAMGRDVEGRSGEWTAQPSQDAVGRAAPRRVTAQTVMGNVNSHFGPSYLAEGLTEPRSVPLKCSKLLATMPSRGPPPVDGVQTMSGYPSVSGGASTTRGQALRGRC
jgi:hypothetical protein